MLYKIESEYAADQNTYLLWYMNMLLYNTIVVGKSLHFVVHFTAKIYKKYYINYVTLKNNCSTLADRLCIRKILNMMK